MFLQTLALTFSVFLFSAVILFVGVNVGTGCQDWSQSNCVTPAQFLNLLTK